ncbi:hypothetical protein BDD12DRAFT_462902 [Trichophaea hybrida]|nr:hypothetical protein BDD12DRAFT_462902 [Trichophaea hybrida]
MKKALSQLSEVRAGRRRMIMVLKTLKVILMIMVLKTTVIMSLRISSQLSARVRASRRMRITGLKTTMKVISSLRISRQLPARVRVSRRRRIPVLKTTDESDFDDHGFEDDAESDFEPEDINPSRKKRKGRAVINDSEGEIELDGDDVESELDELDIHIAPVPPVIPPGYPRPRARFGRMSRVC